MDWLLNNISKAEAVVVAVTALVLAVIAAYKQIKTAWETRNREALKEATLPLIAQAETQPLALLNSLVTPPAVNPITNEGKTSIVTQALIEREPKLLKKMKLKDALEIGSFIHGLYQFVKPIIKHK